jgi:hypothetical protein
MVQAVTSSLVSSSSRASTSSVCLVARSPLKYINMCISQNPTTSTSFPHQSSNSVASPASSSSISIAGNTTSPLRSIATARNATSTSFPSPGNSSTAACARMSRIPPIFRTVIYIYTRFHRLGDQDEAFRRSSVPHHARRSYPQLVHSAPQSKGR